jgi:hypothetical protein
MTSSPLRAVAAVSVLLFLAAGCGGDSDKGGADSAFAKKPGTEIADAAKADMKTLDSVKFTGEITTDGDDISVEIQASSAGDCTGSIGLGGGTAEVASKDGTSWFRPDETFWRANAGDSAEAIIAAVGDKWVLDTDANFSQFCDLDGFLDSIFDDSSNDGTYKTVGTEEIDGEDVVKVEQKDDDGSATGYVLIDGKHYLVKLERTEGDSPGKLEFSDFNDDVDVDAPSEDEVIDLSTLG